MRPARESGVVRGSENHEKGEKQQRAALELLQWYGDRVAEPEGAAEKDRLVTQDKSVAHVATHGAVDDHAAKAGHKKAK